MTKVTVFGEQEKKAEKKKVPVVVDHGNVFNLGEWFTFHCPVATKK